MDVNLVKGFHLSQEYHRQPLGGGPAIGWKLDWDLWDFDERTIHLAKAITAAKMDECSLPIPCTEVEISLFSFMEFQRCWLGLAVWIDFENSFALKLYRKFANKISQFFNNINLFK